MKDLYSIGQVAREIGVPAFRIKYALETLKVPAPTERFGTHRVFTKRDLERVRKYFDGQRPVRKETGPS